MVKEKNEDIGRRLKRYRNERALTQEKMAELMEISLNFYGQIERGESGISIEKVILLHECLGIDPTFLLTGKINKENSLEGLVGLCPGNKRNSMEQLIKIVIKLILTEEY